MSDSEGDGDLFGDEVGQAAVSDQELDSEQDEEIEERPRARDHDRDLDDNDDEADEDQEVKVKRIMGVTIHRHRTPRTAKDGRGFVRLV